MATMTPEPQRDPLTEPLPVIGVNAASRLLADGWGIEGELSPLPGERDMNFRVTPTSGERVVLKIHNPADGLDVVDFQTAALRHITRVSPDLPVGGVVATRSNTAWMVTSDERGRDCCARVLRHLDGHHAARDELDRNGLYGWGSIVARLGFALRGFVHPAAGYPIAWDVRRLPAVRDWAAALDEERRTAVTAVIDRHATVVAPVLAALRAQVVHNDLSRDNALIDGRHNVTGIIDFGDMTHTSLVCDLAIAIADVLDGRDDSLSLA